MGIESFEQELKSYFKLRKYDFIDNSSDYKKLDFTLKDIIRDVNNIDAPLRNIYLEVKEKRQKYNTTNWPLICDNDEKHTFIVDELSTRKILAYAPYSGLLIRDYLTHQYYWYSILDLFLMPKLRVNRPIKKHDVLSMKGKLILDYRNSVEADSLDKVFEVIIAHISNRVYTYTEMKECYGKFINEEILEQGIVRKAEHWDIDVTETR